MNDSINLDFVYEKYPWLKEVIKQKDDEIANLRRWNNDLMDGSFVTCVYCGYRYGPKDSTLTCMADILKQHIEVCPKNPLSSLKEKLLENMVNYTKNNFKPYPWFTEDLNKSNLSQNIKNIEEMFEFAIKEIK